MRPWLTVLAILCATAQARVEEERVQTPSATVNYDAMFYQWGSPWAGALDAILGGSVRLDASSSQPKGFLSRLYDGNPGSLAEPTGSFLIFDQSRAAIRVRVPAWREVQSFGFYALEAKAGSKASAQLFFATSGAPEQRIPLARQVVDTKAGLAHVEYHSRGERLALSGGEFFLVYDNPDLGSAFIGEIVVDELGTERKLPSGTKGDRSDVCPGTTSSACEAKDARTLLGALRAPKKNHSDPSLVFWQRTGAASGIGLHSLLIRTGNSGTREIDLTAGWLAYPTKAVASVPLVVLVNDPASPFPSLELLGLAGRPEYALAPAMVSAGMAVLVVNFPRLFRPDRDDPQFYLDRLDAALSEVLEGSFSRHARLGLDRQRIGIWGEGNAATLALLAALVDGRYAVVGLSQPPRHYCVGLSFNSACGAGEDAMQYLRAELSQGIGERHALVVVERETIANWKVGGVPRKNIEIRGTAYPNFGEDDKKGVVEFFSSRLGGPRRQAQRPMHAMPIRSVVREPSGN